MKSKPMLDNSDVAAMARECRVRALQNGWAVCIAIVDDGGYLMYLERLDGAALHTPEVATGKARTSATMQIPTGVLEDAVKDRSSILASRERTLLRGGVPILHDGHCLGGIGVAGVLGTQDEEVARIGADAFSALWRPRSTE